MSFCAIQIVFCPSSNGPHHPTISKDIFLSNPRMNDPSSFTILSCKVDIFPPQTNVVLDKKKKKGGGGVKNQLLLTHSKRLSYCINVLCIENTIFVF